MKNLFFIKIIKMIFSEKIFCINIENADAYAVVIKRKNLKKLLSNMKNVPRI